jgi:hypothetical protein
MRGQPATTYEYWVRTIRDWSLDDSVTLAGLPPLTEESLPAGAFERLITHINQALETAADGWVAALSKTLASIGDPAALALDLVALRRKLARRLELARHPALPQVLRDAFSGAVDRSVRDAQQQIETAIKNLSRDGRTPTSVVDALHRVTRENSFVAVLAYTADTPGGRFTPNHRLPDPPGSDPPVLERPRVRRIIV